MATGVEDDATSWKGAIVAVESEVLQHGVRPTAASGGQFENRTDVRTSAVDCGAIETTGCVESEVAVRQRPTSSALKAVNHGRCPTIAGVREHEDCAAIQGAAVSGGAREVADLVKDEPAEWVYSVGRRIEAVENILCPSTARGNQLVNHATVVSTPCIGHTIEVAGLIADDTTLGSAPITSAGE